MTSTGATTAVTDRAPRLAPAPPGARPAAEEARWAAAGDLRVHARSWRCDRVPPEPPVVLVHGLGVASRMCQPVAERLALRHHVHAPDLPGFGLSARPEATLTITEHADALAAWMTSVDLHRALLVGTSWGCQVAVETALRHPRRCAALVLGSPTVDRSRRRWRSQLWRWQVEQAGHSLRMRRIQLGDYARCGLGRVVRTFAEALDDPVEDKVADLVQPLLVCRGGRDPLVSRAWAEELAGRARDGRLALLAGAKHALSHESPLEFARAIAGAVDEHATDAGRHTAPHEHAGAPSTDRPDMRS